MSIYFRVITGIVVICTLALLISYDISAQPLGIGGTREEQRNYDSVLSSERGRYVFGQVSDDLFMLDTETGRLWRITESGKIGLYLKTVPYRMESDEYFAFPDSKSGASGHMDKPGQ